MELNINSPVYYTTEYGVIDEIYRMCEEIRYWVKDKSYSPIVDIVGIIPIIVPKEVIGQGLCREHKRCEAKAGFASVCLQIDYETFVSADIQGKRNWL